MLKFLSQNIATIVVALILASIVTLIVIKMHKDKKAGKSACGCKCTGCANSSVCHGNKK